MNSAPQPALAWSFNGSNVDSVTNLSPSLTTGTPTYTTGKYGQGIFFPFYNTGSTPSITYTIPSISCNGITICMWAYFNDLSMFRLDSVNQNIFTATVPNTGATIQQLAINSRTAGGTQNMLFQGINGASGFFSYTATVAKQWYHLTLVSSGSGSPSSYVNGVSYATAGSTLTPFSLSSLSLSGNNCVYNDLRIYNTALSAAQILGIYQSQGIPPTITVVPTSGNLYGATTVQPSLLFSLNGTTNDSILGIQGVVSGTTQYVTGKYSQAFNFLNVQGAAPTNYITTGNFPISFSNTAGFTCSFWINFSSTVTANQYNLGLYNGDTGKIVFYFVVIFAGTQCAFRGDPAVRSGAATANMNFFPVAGTWYHFALSVNTTAWNAYINGALRTEASGTYAATNLTNINGPLWMGDHSGNNGLTGLLQDVRIYNTALSTQQIQGIYQSQGIPPSLTMNPATGGLLLPAHAFPLNSSNVDVITNLSPSTSTLTTSTTYAPTYVTGLLGQQAMYLNNSTYTGSPSANCYVQYTLPATYQLDAGLTLTFWAKINSFPPSSQQQVVNLDNSVTTGGPGGVGTRFRVWASGSPGTNWMAYLYGPAQIITSSTAAVIGTWYNLTLCANPLLKTTVLYINGVAAASTAYVSGYSVNTLTLDQTTQSADVTIQDVRIYTTALSSTQIQTIYQSGGKLYGATSIQPALLWSLNGSNVETFTNLSPSLTTGTPTYQVGKYGQAYFFNNPTSGNPTSNIYYATIPLFTSTPGFTLSFWFKFTPGSFYTAVPVSLGGAGGYLFYFINPSDRKIFVQAPTPLSADPATPAISLNTWYNLASVVTPLLITTYLNGVQTGTNTCANFNVTNAFIGSSGSSYPFIGNVQDLRMYSTALSTSQIQAIYQSGGASPMVIIN